MSHREGIRMTDADICKLVALAIEAFPADLKKAGVILKAILDEAF